MSAVVTEKPSPIAVLERAITTLAMLVNHSEEQVADARAALVELEAEQGCPNCAHCLLKRGGQ